MHPLFQMRHLLTTITLAGLLGGGGFAAVGFAAADAGAQNESDFALAAVMEGDAGTYVLEPGPVDEDDLKRGIDPNPTGRMDFVVGATKMAFDEHGIERIATPLLVRMEDGGRVKHHQYLFDGPFGDAFATESVTVHDYAEGEDEVDETTWWGTRYNSNSLRVHCAFNAPFDVAALDGNWHLDDRNCKFGPYALDADEWQWKAAAIGEQEGVRVLEIHLVYGLANWNNEPDAKLWYREDMPYPVRMEDITGYAGTNDGDAWVLTTFERGDRIVASGVTGRVLPPIQYSAATEVMFDDSRLDSDFTLSDAVARARLEHAPLQDWERAHADARMLCARHAHFNMESESWRWTFWFADGSDQFGIAVSKRIEQGDATSGAAIVYSYDEQPGGCPYSSDEVPRTYPESLPSMDSVKAVADMLLAPHYNPDGDFGWEFQIMDGGWMLNAGQTYYYREQGEADPLASLLGAEPQGRLDVWDIANVEFEHGRLKGFGGSDQIHASGQYADSTNAAPDGSESETVPVTGAWAIPPTKAIAGVTIGAGAVAIAYWLSPLAKAPLLGLFSRVRKDRALEHPVRANIVELIQAEPGIHFQDIVRRTAKGRGTVDHHLKILCDKGLVGVRVGPGYRCFFLPGQVDRRLMDAAPVLKAPAAKNILRSLQQEQRVTDLAIDLGLSKASVSRHVKRMEEAGLVSRRRAGRDQWLRATELGMRARGPRIGVHAVAAASA